MSEENKKEAERPSDQSKHPPVDPVKEKKAPQAGSEGPDCSREEGLNEEATKEANNEEELDKI